MDKDLGKERQSNKNIDPFQILEPATVSLEPLMITLVWFRNLKCE